VKKTILLCLSLALILGLCACGRSANRLTDGVLAMEDFSMDFGQSSLSDGDAQLAESRAKDVPEGLVSPLYELTVDKDCPESVAVSVTLSPDQIAEADNLMLGVGMDYTGKTGETETVYQYMDTTLSGDTLTASFVPADFAGTSGGIRGAGASAAPDDGRLRCKIAVFDRIVYYLTDADGERVNASDGHFSLTLPKAGKGKAQYMTMEEANALLTDLEEAYLHFLSLGYDYELRTAWPMRVHIEDLGSCEGAYWPLKGINASSISLNRNLVDNGYAKGSAKNYIYHEFFHFVQHNYTTVATNNTWVDEATATYFEWTAKQDGTPQILSATWKNTLQGVFPSVSSASDGYARMPLFQYLCGRFGEDCIRQIYENSDGGYLSPQGWEEGIAEATADPASYAADYYTKLVTGELAFPYTPYALYQNLRDGVDEFAGAGTSLTLNIPSEDEVKDKLDAEEEVVLGSTSVSVYQNGTQYIALTLDEDEQKKLTDGANPVLKVDPDTADLRVLCIKGAQVEVLTGAGSVTIPDFKAKLSENWSYLIQVVGLHGSGWVSNSESYEVTVALSGYPTLPELEGTYTDGTMTYTKVTISDELLAEVQSAPSEPSGSSEPSGDGGIVGAITEGLNEQFAGCDMHALVETLQALEGQTMPSPFSVTAMGETDGVFNMVIVKDGEASDRPLSMTYDPNTGIMQIDHTDEVSVSTGTLRAAYGKEKTVTLNGDIALSMIMEGYELFRIDITFAGAKPVS